MSDDRIRIEYERGYNGEYVIRVDGNFYCTADNWQEVKQVRNEILSQDILMLCH